MALRGQRGVLGSLPTRSGSSFRRTTMHISELDVTNLERGNKNACWLDISPRVEGGWWQIPFLSVTGTQPGPTLVVFAGVHGDEYEGVEAIPRIAEQVNPPPTARHTPHGPRLQHGRLRHRHPQQSYRRAQPRTRIPRLRNRNPHPTDRLLAHPQIHQRSRLLHRPPQRRRSRRHPNPGRLPPQR